MNEFELEEELEKTEVIIDVDQLVKSNIKQISLPLYRVIEWRCLDVDGKTLRKSEIFDSCLNTKDAKKAKQLNTIYQTRIWNLLDEDVKKGLKFEYFVD